MTGNDFLDQLAPSVAWEPDWPGVLDRAGERLPRPSHWTAGLRSKHRLIVAAGLFVAALVPLAALGAANDWWFFRFGRAPAPLNAPVVVKEGEWSGHLWQLIAYPSRGRGLCFAVAPKGSNGADGGLGCTPMAGLPSKASTGMTITYLSGWGNAQLPNYIAGPVIDDASAVEVRFGTGQLLRVQTFSAPASLGHVRFYATQLPAGVPPAGPPTSTAAGRFIDTLTGLDAHGNIVACLVPATAVNGVSPLSACR